MASSSKRSTYTKHDGPVLEWSGKPPTKFRWLPWQDIVALLGFAVAMAVFAMLMFWGMSEGAVW